MQPPSEDREAPEEHLLLRREQVVAPGDGVAHRPLALRAGRAPPPVSSGSRCSSRASSAGGGSSLDPRGGQLDGQRQSVQPPADRGNGGGVVGCQREVGLGGLARARRRGGPLRMLATSLEAADADPAQRQAERGTGNSCSPERRRRTRLVTSIVSVGTGCQANRPRCGAASITCSKLSSSSRRRLSRSDRRQPLGERRGRPPPARRGPGDGGSDQGWVADRGERDEGDAVGEVVGRQRRGDPECEAGLAHAAGAGQGQQRHVLAQQQSRTAAISRSRPMSGVRGSGTWMGSLDASDAVIAALPANGMRWR